MALLQLPAKANAQATPLKLASLPLATRQLIQLGACLLEPAPNEHVPYHKLVDHLVWALPGLKALASGHVLSLMLEVLGVPEQEKTFVAGVRHRHVLGNYRLKALSALLLLQLTSGAAMDPKGAGNAATTIQAIARRFFTEAKVRVLHAKATKAATIMQASARRLVAMRALDRAQVAKAAERAASLAADPWLRTMAAVDPQPVLTPMSHSFFPPAPLPGSAGLGIGDSQAVSRLNQGFTRIGGGELSPMIGSVIAVRPPAAPGAPLPPAPLPRPSMAYGSRFATLASGSSRSSRSSHSSLSSLSRVDELDETEILSGNMYRILTGLVNFTGQDGALEQLTQRACTLSLVSRLSSPSSLPHSPLSVLSPLSSSLSQPPPHSW